MPLSPPPPPFGFFFWKPNVTKKFQLVCISCPCSLQKKSNLRCAISVCATSRHKYFMPKSKVHHLLSPDIKYGRLRGDIHTQVATLYVNMTFREGLLTLTLELWQNDIFLVLMWSNFTICRIMQLIFRNSGKLIFFWF